MPKFKRSNITISGFIKITKENGDFMDIDMNGLKGTSKSGVYEIVNRFNGKRYIGMARDLNVRMLRHWRDIYNRKHSSKEMIEDYNRVIEYEGGFVEATDVFEFNVIIYCRPSELTFWENILIKYLNPEYNVHKQKPIEFGCDPDQKIDHKEKGTVYPDNGTIDKLDFPIFPVGLGNITQE